MIALQCQCGKNLKVDDRYAGRLVRCPHCSQQVRVACSAGTMNPAPRLTEVLANGNSVSHQPLVMSPSPSQAPVRRSAKWIVFRGVAAGLIVLVVAMVLVGILLLRQTPTTPVNLGDSVGLVVIYDEYELTYPEGKLTVQEPFNTGSCFAITSDGFLLTNRHVAWAFTHHWPNIEAFKKEMSHIKLGAGTPDVKFVRTCMMACFGKSSGLHYRAKVVYEDPSEVMDRDMAILKVQAHFSQPLLFGKGVSQGETISIAGFPGAMMAGIGQEDLRVPDKVRQNFRIGETVRYRDTFSDDVFGNPSVSRGIINAVRGNHLETDARLLHGNSGGPLLNSHWQVVGIATWAESAGRDVVNFAIDVRPLQDTIEKEIQNYRAMGGN